MLAEKDSVRLEVLNMAGDVVKTLLNCPLRAGYHTLRWDGTGESKQSLPSGIYFYRLTTSDTVLTEKNVLLK